MRKALVGCALAVLAAGCVTVGDVADETVDRVRERKADKEYEKNLWCPKCGEEKIAKTRWGKLGLLEGIKGKYRCKKCGYKFD